MRAAGAAARRELHEWPPRRAYRQVLDVLVLGVDDVGQVLAVHLLLEDPHVHVVLELIGAEHVAADDLGDRRAPVARADDGDLLLLRGGRAVEGGRWREYGAHVQLLGGAARTDAPPRMRRASRRVPATAASTEQSRVARSILVGGRRSACVDGGAALVSAASSTGSAASGTARAHRWKRVVSSFRTGVGSLAPRLLRNPEGVRACRPQAET